MEAENLHWIGMKKRKCLLDACDVNRLCCFLDQIIVGITGPSLDKNKIIIKQKKKG